MERREEYGPGERARGGGGEGDMGVRDTCRRSESSIAADCGGSAGDADDAAEAA